MKRSEKLSWLTFAVALLHHADHVLRVDHSGWPLLPRVSPFTYSLLVYPVFLSIFLARSKPWYRVVATGFLFLFASVAHLSFEPLRDKYHTWTYGSDLPGHVGEQNLLGVNSPVLGIVSVALAAALSVCLFLTGLAFLNDARRQTK